MVAVHGRIDSAARARRKCTGEPYQYARAQIAASPQRPLPQAHEAQAFLESQVMQHLASGGAWWTHPTGLGSVRISPSGLLIHLDRHNILADGTTFDMDSYALSKLLPYAVGDQIYGVIALRARAADNRDLALTLAGQPGRVVLRAQAGTNWRRLLAELRSDVADPDTHPLWREAAITRHEQSDLAAHPLLRGAERKISWLGSALLRRIALFENHSSAYSTHSWITGHEWIFELDTANDVQLDHDSFLAWLTDPVWGLPVEISDKFCDCRSAALQGRRTYQCTYYLAHRAGLYGVMQIRFRSVSVTDQYRQELRQQFAAMRADPAWLERVLPPCQRERPDPENGRGLEALGSAR